MTAVARMTNARWCAFFTIAVLLVFLRPTGSPAWAASSPTAKDVIARIQQHVGIPWQGDTVDTFKAGDPDTPVTGIAVTMMATLDVLQRAAAANQNLIITHEPTFFDHLDRTEGLESEKDPVYVAKRDFIKAHGLVVWRFHDYWHRRRPDGILAGMVDALGWQKYQSADAPMRFVLPSTSLNALAADIRQHLHAATMRVVGPPDMQVTRIGFIPGAAPYDMHRRMLQSDVQVLVIGEAREWETVEYVADAVSARQDKALIIIGHIPSEQAGMDECVRWLRGFVSEVPVAFVPAADPFWPPKQ
jgi:putative NIF3 family GTP cyclohydrolase 1 type 2